MKKLLLSLLASAAVAISASADTWTYTQGDPVQWINDNQVVINGKTWTISYSKFWRIDDPNVALAFKSNPGATGLNSGYMTLTCSDFNQVGIKGVTLTSHHPGIPNWGIIPQTKISVSVKGDKYKEWNLAYNAPENITESKASVSTFASTSTGDIEIKFSRTGNTKEYSHFIKGIVIDYAPRCEEVIPVPCESGENLLNVEVGTTLTFTCNTPGVKLNYNIKENNNSGKKLIEGKAVDLGTTYTFNKIGVHKLWVQATGAEGLTESYGRDNIYYNVVAPAPAEAPQPSVADGQTVEENTAVEFSVPGADRVYVRSYDIFGRLGDAVEYNGNTAQVNVDLMNRRFEVHGVRNVAAGFDGTGAANTVMYNVATADNTAVPYTVSLSHNPWATGSAPMRAASQHGTTAIVAENGRITYTTHDVYNLSGQIDLSLNGIAMAGTAAEANGKSHVYVPNRQPITLVAATSADAAPLSTNNGDELILHANPELTVTLDPFKSATLAISSNDGTVTGITDITAPTDGTTRLYNLQGVEVDASTAAPGLYIQRQGHTAKVVRK